ncbi:tRNA-dihydrouridine synthase [Chitinivorax sp. B]|uniref:tRNA dihydrouridine synthase n=1 Tax=Chitinivorax sp. B TaxID=2502235 RepID=UPI0010F44D04|nr:tRNA-dihydrouridine synthase [Chitinivorax sp. B]
MRIVLAPMEGLVDDVMRDVLTQVGGVDWCVTEFIRITDSLLPPKVYYRLAPELMTEARTSAGIPVRLQLLGSDPGCLAENAARAAELGAPVIDLNFGCPAKCVNRHRGGAALLTEPALLNAIVHAVRQAVPAAIPVTAKMRLGYEDKSLALTCAQALADGGAAELVVHARTKVEGYKPPAHWHWIARIKEAVTCPVIANGEIWTVEDYLQCRRESECDDIMLGRGLVSRPDLARQVKQALAGQPVVAMQWSDMLPVLANFFDKVANKIEVKADSKHAPGRLKQWLSMLRRSYPEADDVFGMIRQLHGVPDISALLADLQREPVLA